MIAITKALLWLNKKNLENKSIMGYESSYFGFGSPQQQVDMHARSKKTLSLS